jgi:hypothetical protein
VFLVSSELPYAHLCFCSLVLGRHGCAGVVDGVVLGTRDGECGGAGICLGGAEGFIRKVALLEGELVEARRAQDVAKEKVAACQARRLRVRGGWWFLRQSADSSSQNFPFCVLGALSCASPLSACRR